MGHLGLAVDTTWGSGGTAAIVFLAASSSIVCQVLELVHPKCDRDSRVPGELAAELQPLGAAAGCRRLGAASRSASFERLPQTSIRVRSRGRKQSSGNCAPERISKTPPGRCVCNGSGLPLSGRDDGLYRTRHFPGRSDPRLANMRAAPARSLAPCRACPNGSFGLVCSYVTMAEDDLDKAPVLHHEGAACGMRR